jgi:hypothetical protein
MANAGDDLVVARALSDARAETMAAISKGNRSYAGARWGGDARRLSAAVRADGIVHHP